VETYFAFPYDGAPFEPFGAAHWGALGVIFALGLIFWLFRDRLRRHRFIRLSFAILLLANEIGWHLWHLAHGLWNVQNLLPLNLCNVLVLLSVYSLAVKKQVGYEFVYLLGIPAASQVLLTPALGMFGFPHILFFQIFISHGGVVLAALYLTFVEKLRPAGWKAVLRVILWASIYAILIFLINPLIGGNYLFLAHKPPAATLMDILGDWPWYIVWMEMIGIGLVGMMYLPFQVRIWLKSSRGRLGDQ